MRSRRRFRISGAAACAAVPSLVSAATAANWAGPNSGNWTTASLWSTDPIFPNNGGSTYDAIIDAAATPYTVTLNSSYHHR